MKALTLWQPYASLVAAGVKTIETRSWSTRYRGPLAIHAAKQHYVGRWSPELLRATDALHGGMAGYPDTFPLGEVVATCELADCLPIEGMTIEGRHGGPSDVWPRLKAYGDGVLGIATAPDTVCGWERCEGQRPYGNYYGGRFAWLLDDIRPLDPPRPAKGHQGLWNWEVVPA